MLPLILILALIAALIGFIAIGLIANNQKYMENENIADNQFKGKGAFDAFLNLLCLISLGWMSISLGAIFFQIINKFFAVAISSGSFSQSSLKFSIASAIIITPVFLVAAGWLHRNYKTGNLNSQSGIRRWLTYLMLLVSALTVIGRLVYQLFRFLDGDYTAAVILRTVTILIIAGGIFGYYFYDLLRKEYAQKSLVSILAVILAIAVASAGVIGGFFIIDSPAKARALQFDVQRENDLSNLENSINYYYQQNGLLPADLSLPQFSGFDADPETKIPYDYKVLSAEQYELCAVFALPAASDRSNYLSGVYDIHAHGAGRQCFSRKASGPNSILIKN